MSIAYNKINTFYQQGGDFIKNASFVILCCIFAVFVIPYINLENTKTASKASDTKINVYNHITGAVITYNLEEYVWRVVSGEMYHSYHPEALKAQAVAVRTYALKKADSSLPEHNGGDVCTNPSHCMAFVSDEQAKERWKEKYSEITADFKKSAYDTIGEVITYNDEYATAVFHAISSGTTESAAEVWGGNAPYLSNNNSLLDKNAEGYKTVASFTHNEIKNKMGITADELKKASAERTAAGGVKLLKTENKSFTGSEIRSFLNLRSTNFEYEITQDAVIFTVYGYGHGIGMSQAGANEYANAGYTYDKILEKYYPGTVLTKIKNHRTIK